MFKKTMFAVLLGLLCGASAPAQETAADEAKLAGSAVYSDPGFHLLGFGFHLLGFGLAVVGLSRATAGTRLLLGVENPATALAYASLVWAFQSFR